MKALAAGWFVGDGAEIWGVRVELTTLGPGPIKNGYSIKKKMPFRITYEWHLFFYN